MSRPQRSARAAGERAINGRWICGVPLRRRLWRCLGLSLGGLSRGRLRPRSWRSPPSSPTSSPRRAKQARGRGAQSVDERDRRRAPSRCQPRQKGQALPTSRSVVTIDPWIFATVEAFLGLWRNLWCYVDHLLASLQAELPADSADEPEQDFDEDEDERDLDDVTEDEREDCGNFKHNLGRRPC